MANFGQDFLKGFTNVNYLRDYTHASKTFTSNQYELKPRFKFLFHVSFTLNTQIPSLNKFVTTGDISSLSYVVKTVDLPKYNVKTETLNQYNRKRVIQTGIEYQPVTLTFHDDGGDVTRNLWYNYFSYYYKDQAKNISIPIIPMAVQVPATIHPLGLTTTAVTSIQTIDKSTTGAT